MVNGGLFMSKPDFSQMNGRELRTYILANREDDDALAALINRAAPNAPTYDFPATEEGARQMQELFQRKIRGEKGL
jgi:hypothetical protein